MDYKKKSINLIRIFRDGIFTDLVYIYYIYYVAQVIDDKNKHYTIYCESQD